MKTNDILVLIDEKAAQLTQENNHAAAILMQLAADRIRELAGQVRGMGGDAK